MSEPRYTEAEWRLITDLREHWHMFTDADPFEGSDTFPDRMEAAGYCRLVSVTKEALQEAFAAERGIEPGGMMWELTPAGHEAFAGAQP